MLRPLSGSPGRGRTPTPMLLICQSVSAASGGSQPSFSATVACRGAGNSPPPVRRHVLHQAQGEPPRRRTQHRARRHQFAQQPELVQRRGRRQSQPGQGKPEHCTQADGAVLVSPASMPNARMPAAPPAASTPPSRHRYRCPRSSAPRASPLPRSAPAGCRGEQRFEYLDRDDTGLVLCPASIADCPGLMRGQVIYGHADCAEPARQVAQRRPGGSASRVGADPARGTPRRAESTQATAGTRGTPAWDADGCATAAVRSLARPSSYTNTPTTAAMHSPAKAGPRPADRHRLCIQLRQVPSQ